MLLHKPLAVLTAVVSCCAATCQSVPTVKIQNGTITGSADHVSGVEKFLGIPFAQPPVGNLRLRHAVPLNASLGTFSADAFGSACISGSDQPGQSEDCLTLNIWRPSDISSSSGPVPVFVWLYGGSFTKGYTADPRFEGTNLVRISREIGKPVVYVSLNYRLGPFGFLNGNQMADLGLLNLGLLDQRFALRWIQENIGAFGGDPSKVTLFGQSAGAVSIYSHLTAHGGRDDRLFRGAILESGGAFPLTLANTTAFQQSYDTLITNTTCSSFKDATAEKQLDCIRTLPVDVFRSAVGRSTGQAIDGDFTRTSIQFSMPRGDFIRVPIMVGANTDEGTTSAPTGINTTSQLAPYLVQGFHRPAPLPDDMVETIMSMYPTEPQLGCPYNTGTIPMTGTSGTLDKMACSIFGDLVQIGPARLIARSYNSYGVPTYRYRFNYMSRNNTILAHEGISTGTEQIFVFSNLVADFPWDKALAYAMTSAWVSFAYHLDPNPGKDSSLPHWPVYGDEANSIVLEGTGSYIESDTYRKDQIDYLIENVLPYGAS